MYTILSALFPVFTVIALGYGLRQARWLPEEFWRGTEKLTYFVLVPCLFLRLALKAELGNSDLFYAPLLPLSAIAAVTVFLLVFRRSITPSKPAFASIYLGAIRFNNYVLLPIAMALYGTEGMEVTALLVSVMVPAGNLLCVSMLAHYGDNTVVNRKQIIGRVITNPLILTCSLGLLANYAGITLPKFLDDTLGILAAPALTLGLLAVGAGIDLKALHRVGKPLLIPSIMKLLVMPALVLLCGLVLRVDTLILHVVVLFAAIPSATSSYILTRQMGGDNTLMANIIAFQTVAAAITIPLVLLVADYLI